MEIVLYPHPTLRYTSKPVKRVDQSLKSTVAKMFELMYQHEGVGLAANQVDLPLQLFVANPTGIKGDGEEWVFINPVIRSPKGSSEVEEGCLSLPSVYGNVARPETIHVSAYDLTGREIDQVFDGYLARIIQHEFDHLAGTLFIDRISDWALAQLRPALEEFELDFASKTRAGSIPPTPTILERLQRIEQEYA